MNITDLHLPKKFTAWREGQAEAILEIANAFSFPIVTNEDRDRVGTFLLEAPTGVGKSVIGVGTSKYLEYKDGVRQVVDRLAGEDVNLKPRRTVYLTATKQLQEQLLNEFPFARSIMGRNNYVCPPYRERFPEITAEDCTHTNDQPCKFRDECPYWTAKLLARKAEIAVLNTSYFLAEANNVGVFSGNDLLIIDEIDALESELMNHIQLEISETQLKRLGLQSPMSTSSLHSWVIWANELSMRIPRIQTLELELKVQQPAFWTDIEIKQHKSLVRLKHFQNKLKLFVQEVTDRWVFYEEKDEEDNNRSWVFKPLEVSEYAHKYIWAHATHSLGMSATILAPGIVGTSLGLLTWGYRCMNKCPFPIDHRPIYFKPAVNMRWSAREKELPKLAEAVETLLQKYQHAKVLVHAVSYDLRDYLLENLKSKGRLISHTKATRAAALQIFKESRDPLVMVSPSFQRGADLPGVKCIIVCKMPYMKLNDPQVAGRMKIPGGQLWYSLKAAQDLVQMTGRAVRSMEDHCDSIILDAQFTRLMSRVGHWMPKWWKEALKMEHNFKGGLAHSSVA